MPLAYTQQSNTPLKLANAIQSNAGINRVAAEGPRRLAGLGPGELGTCRHKVYVIVLDAGLAPTIRRRRMLLRRSPPA